MVTIAQLNALPTGRYPISRVVLSRLTWPEPKLIHDGPCLVYVQNTGPTHKKRPNVMVIITPADIEFAEFGPDGLTPWYQDYQEVPGVLCFTAEDYQMAIPGDLTEGDGA